MSFCLKFLLIFLCLNSAALASKLAPKELSLEQIKLYYAYDDSLPIIALNIALKDVGNAYESKQGTNAIVNYLARNLLFLGEERQKFSNEIAKRNINISFKSDIENFYISLKFMPSDLDLVAQILYQFFYDFKVSDEALAKAREYVKFSQNSAYKNSNFISYQNFNQIFFDARFSRDGFLANQNYEQIDSTVISNFIKTLTNKAYLNIAVVGAIGIKEVKQLVKTVFSNFTESPVASHHIAQLTTASLTQTFNLSGYDQIIFYAGLKGIARNEPNFYDFYILNYLFGGSARSSLIGNKLREVETLTYSGYSYIDYLNQSSFMTVYFACDKHKYTKAKQVITSLLTSIKTHQFTEAELTAAKQHLIGKYAIAFTSNSEIAGFLLGLLINDLPVSMFAKRNQLINQVSLASLQNMRDKIFADSDFVMAITGDFTAATN